ncbi:MAG: radical SAM protein [Deltaproteobacteria bacterium]|nr:radical SAM protein [Deltaproteobacteria bacterium]
MPKLRPVLFLNPPFKPEFGRFSREQRSPAITKSGTFYYPMWLCYAAALVRQRGWPVQVIDAPAKRLTLQQVLSQVKTLQPGLVVLDTSTASIVNDVQVGEAIKALLPETAIILVGPHVSATAAETLALSTRIDAVARREYEFTILAAAQALAEHHGPVSEALADIDGLSYRDASGQIFHNPDRPLVEDLSQFPWVSRIYKDFLNYRDYFYSGNLYPVVTIIAGRGCPHRCNFCVYPQTFTGNFYRRRPVVDLVDEICYILKNFSPLGEIMLEDDTIDAKKQHCLEFCEEILRRGLKCAWSANSRVDLDLETMKLMKRAGCRSLLVGFESGSEDLLREMKKGININKSINFMENARKAGILINGTFLVGLEGETLQTMQATVDLAIRLNPDIAQFFPIMVYPGTALYDRYREKGYIKAESYADWVTPEGLHNCVIDLPDLSGKDLVRFCDQARRAFYLRPGYWFYKFIQGLTNPREGLRTLLAARTFFKYLWRGSFPRQPDLAARHPERRPGMYH